MPPTRSPLGPRLVRAWRRLPAALALTAVVAPLLGVLWGALLFDLRSREAQLEASYQDRIYNVTQVSAQALLALFVAADQTLLDLRADWAREPAQFAQTVTSRRRADSLGVEFDISMVDASGVVRYSSMDARAHGMQVGNVAHFTQHRDTQVDQLHIGTPIRARLAERWMIPLSRRLPPGPQGEFTGVIVFWVAPEFFSRIYQSTRLYPGSVFTLIDLNQGRILLRNLKPSQHTAPPDATPPFSSNLPLTQIHSQTPFMPPEALQNARSLPRTGTGHWASALDTLERNYAWHRFSAWPLLLMAGEPRHYLQAEADSDRLRYLWAGGLLSGLIVLTALGQLLYLRTRVSAARDKELQLERLRQQRHELQASRHSLRQLGQHLVDVRETERRRIAQDLHDDIGQQLSVLRMGAAQLQRRLHQATTAALTRTATACGDPDPTEPEPDFEPHAIAAGQLKDQIDDTIATVRTISEDLRPAALDVGLQAAVHSLCDELHSNTGLLCHVQDQLPPTAQPSQACATAAYRILQEAASNTLRHAHAHQLWVRLATEGPSLLLEVRDDGIGIQFPPDAERSHFGLMGMRERAMALGGQLRVHSQPGQGTTLSARLPLGATPASAAPTHPTPPQPQ